MKNENVICLSKSKPPSMEDPRFADFIMEHIESGYISIGEAYKGLTLAQTNKLETLVEMTMKNCSKKPILVSRKTIETLKELC